MTTRHSLARGSFALIALWVIAMAAADEKATDPKTSPKEKDDWITKSGGPPPELRGGNFKPTGKVSLPEDLADWDVLFKISAREEIKVIRLYGFREYQKEKSPIDFKTKDRAIAKALQVSVHESAALRPTISDIGKTGGGGGAGAGHYMGIMEIETPKRKVIIGVARSGFYLGRWIGTGRQLFFSWGLAEVVDELLFKATGKHLRKEHFSELSGEAFVARSRKYWEEARKPKKKVLKKTP